MYMYKMKCHKKVKNFEILDRDVLKNCFTQDTNSQCIRIILLVLHYLVVLVSSEKKPTADPKQDIEIKRDKVKLSSVSGVSRS